METNPIGTFSESLKISDLNQKFTLGEAAVGNNSLRYMNEVISYLIHNLLIVWIMDYGSY